MKLLRIIPSLNPRGGGPMEGARQIDAELIERGHSVEVVCVDPPGMEFHSTYPATVHALGPGKLGYRYSGRLVPWLKRNRKRFDAVIVNGIWQYHALAAWRALAGTDTPYFVFTHGMLDPWFKHHYPLKHIKKWAYWPWADFRVLRDAEAVLFTSEEERRLARNSFWLYKCKEIVTAYGTQPPPIDTDGRLANQFRHRHPELQDKRILLFLSRIHEKKGCDLLIDAFAKVAFSYPDLHLVLAGPDQTGWTAYLRAQAESLGITDRVTWPGMLEGSDKWSAFYAAEIFCLPSHQENFGIVVAEAMGCGKPVLISDKVNIWREIEAAGAGIVGADTSDATASGLELWLNLPAERRRMMGEAARHCFESQFHISRVAGSIENIVIDSFNTVGAKQIQTSDAGAR